MTECERSAARIPAQIGQIPRADREVFARKGLKAIFSPGAVSITEIVSAEVFNELVSRRRRESRELRRVKARHPRLAQ